MGMSDGIDEANGCTAMSRKRSNSRARNSRPTTPLRPSSRSSFRDSARNVRGGGAEFPLNVFEPAFAELSDAMADLEANMMHFQLMHESLARFSESFASFLYGLNMNAFCVDFPEGPIAESFARDRHEETSAEGTTRLETDVEATFIPEPSKLVNPVCLLHVVQIREGGQILEIGLDQVASQEVAVAVEA
ncbi:DASH complex subunit DAM1 [Metarhizium anisopliae]|nr:DASH complex subunit DAM1 [Metarhizium anisopliae]